MVSNDYYNLAHRKVEKIPSDQADFGAPSSVQIAKIRESLSLKAKQQL